MSCSSSTHSRPCGILISVAEQGIPNSPLRIYTDTSVIGGCFDEEFAEHSNRLMDQARAGQIRLLISEVVTRELEPAPSHIKRILSDMPDGSIEVIPLHLPILTLRDAYLDAGVVERRALDDAMHVAAATVARADAIVSWNFRHIVRLDRIRLYNEVNEQQGHPRLTILSPMEVRFGDDDG